MRTRHTEECRLEAVEHYRKAREIDPKETIADCARELGINDETLNDRILKYEGTGRVTQARTEEQLETDRTKRGNERFRRENEFLKEAAAFFARGLAQRTGSASCRRREPSSSWP